MANMKKTIEDFRMNQMMPGTQVNGTHTESGGGSQPPRNRIVRQRAHQADGGIFAEHEHQVRASRNIRP